MRLPFSLLLRTLCVSLRSFPNRIKSTGFQRADVLVWGEVAENDKVLRLRFLSQSGNGGGTKAYRLNEVLAATSIEPIWSSAKSISPMLRHAKNGASFAARSVAALLAAAFAASARAFVSASSFFSQAGPRPLLHSISFAVFAAASCVFTAHIRQLAYSGVPCLRPYDRHVASSFRAMARRCSIVRQLAIRASLRVLWKAEEPRSLHADDPGGVHVSIHAVTTRDTFERRHVKAVFGRNFHTIVRRPVSAFGTCLAGPARVQCFGIGQP